MGWNTRVPLCQKERESWGERKHSGTFTTVLQISLPGPVAEVWFYCGPHRRGDRGDNLISPAWALSCKLSDSCHKLHLCLCVRVCVCMCVSLDICATDRGFLLLLTHRDCEKNSANTWAFIMLLFLNNNYMCCAWVLVFACFHLGVSEALVWGRSAFAWVY